MKLKKFSTLAISAILSISLLAGCSSNNASSSSASSGNTSTASTSSSSEATNDTDKNKEAGEKLLTDIEGTYQELFSVICDEKYDQVWKDDAAALVGEDKAQESVDALLGSVQGDVIGEDAVEKYKDKDPKFDCEFMQDVEKVTFKGDTISGVDKDGKELFSHTYKYVGYDENVGFYQYKTDDKDAGEFTYFCLLPDTPKSTYHIEFRYGSDLDALCQYDKGDYAYWMASGILVDADEDMAKNAIELFCTENLSDSENK